jgi:hypothetical protein
MRHKAIAATILGTLLLTACATSVPPLRSDLGEIPVLEALSYRPGQSIVIETPAVRAVRLVYRGRIEPGSLSLEVQKALEASGWQLLRGTFVDAHGTSQVYEKGNASLQVRVWEGGLFNYYTYVEVSGTRVTPRTTSTAVR